MHSIDYLIESMQEHIMYFEREGMLKSASEIEEVILHLKFMRTQWDNIPERIKKRIFDNQHNGL